MNLLFSFREILEKYGNAVDALIATMLCDGVTCMQNMGIGGGFIATLYIRSERKVITLNARETAPAAATPDMYTTNKSLSLEGNKLQSKKKVPANNTN